MSFPCFVTPELVRMLDANLEPVNVWMVEFPLWLAKQICDIKAQNRTQQIQPSFPACYFPGS